MFLGEKHISGVGRLVVRPDLPHKPRGSLGPPCEWEDPKALFCADSLASSIRLNIGSRKELSSFSCGSVRQRCECGQSALGKPPRVPYRRATQFGGRLSQTLRSSTTATEFRSESFPTASTPPPPPAEVSGRVFVGGSYATSCGVRLAMPSARRGHCA